MIVIYLLFFTAFFILFYNYVGYGLLLWIIVRIKRMLSPAAVPSATHEPGVTLLVAAYNEALCIEDKIKNSLALDYPADKLELLFITDGSDDGTVEIINRYTEIRHLHSPARQGKTAALNRAMTYVQTPVVIFCDANTLLNKAAVRNIVQHYADPMTGGVAGEKRVSDNGDSGAAGTEGVYWKYESFLKRLDAACYSIVGAAGELFSIRTALYEPVEESVILDDFVISLRIAQKGYRVAYAPDAFAMETSSISMAEEHKRKVRISAGGFQAIVLLRALLNIFRYPVLSFQYISHRVLRWTLSPLSLPVLLISNILILWQGGGILYQGIFALQVLFYVAALAGYVMALQNKRMKLFYIPYYFLFMNIAVYEGFFRFIGRRQSATWEKSVRAQEKVGNVSI